MDISTPPSTGLREISLKITMLLMDLGFKLLNAKSALELMQETAFQYLQLVNAENPDSPSQLPLPPKPLDASTEESSEEPPEP